MEISSSDSGGETLRSFRQMAKADEEQSLIGDLLHFVFNPLPALVVLATMLFLTIIVAPATSSSQLKGNGAVAVPFPSWKLMAVVAGGFQILQSMGFYIGIDPISMPISMPISTNETVMSYKPFCSNFTKFYQEAYIDAHVEYDSRLSHLILSTSVAVLWLWDGRLLVASLAALTTGALCTIPLAACHIEFLEMMIVLVVGLTVSKLCYNTMIRWLIFFVTWMSLDYLDHYLLGHNGSVAIYIGQYMVSWGLIGQLKLAAGMITQGAVRYSSAATS